MTLTVHTLIKNEQRWIWYALNSVLPYADEIMVWDTGSTDKTPEIVTSIHSPKIKFTRLGSVDASTHTKARQDMLSATRSDWILILDGDEIWWHDSLKASLAAIRNYQHKYALISPFYNAVGDIYHYQDPRRNHYSIAGLTGAYNLRFINRSVPGLYVGNPHGRQEYRTGSHTALQNLPSDKLLYVDAPYLHTTHLLRSHETAGDKSTLKRGFKFRYELGRRFPPEFTYPEVFYLPRPEMVPDPFQKRRFFYFVKSAALEPVRLIKQYTHQAAPQGY